MQPVVLSATFRTNVTLYYILEIPFFQFLINSCGVKRFSRELKLSSFFKLQEAVNTGLNNLDNNRVYWWAKTKDFSIDKIRDLKWEELAATTESQLQRHKFNAYVERFFIHILYLSMKHLEMSLKWLQKALNKHIVRLLTVIHNSPQRGSPGSNLIIAFKWDTVTCIGDKDPHEKWSVFSKEYSPPADINIKIVLHPGAISTTCTCVCVLVFAYANINAHTHTYIFLFKFKSFYATFCDEQAASSGCTMQVQSHQEEAFVSFPARLKAVFVEINRSLL